MNIFDYIKYDITKEEIIKIMQTLGSDYKTDANGNLKFKTICHGGESYKLYYFLNSRYFHCFTECQENYSLIDLIMKVKQFDKKDAINLIVKILNLNFDKSKVGFTKNNLIDDWDYLKKYNHKEDEIKNKNKHLNEKVLNNFIDGVYEKWFEEEIYLETCKKFNIKFDIGNNRIVIPHNDINDNLIGIRVRNLDEYSVESGFKYMPMIYNNKMYNHQLQFNLYGLNKNIDYISKSGKIILFESEKSVLRCDTYYKENNFAVAVCGSSISSYQRDIILSLGVKEVFLAFDKEYESIDSDECYEYAENIKLKAKMFSNYCTVYVLWDRENLLEYKDSPVDKGKEVLEKLMKSKIEVKTTED